MTTVVYDMVLTRLLKLRRSAAAVASLATYLGFVWVLEHTHMARVPGALFGVATVVGLAGAVVLPWALAADLRAQTDRGGALLAFAIWGHVALVTTAVLVESPLRLLLLAATLISLTYSALHLKRQQLVWVAAAAWLSYGLGAAWLNVDGAIGTARDALFNCVGYWLAVTGGLLVAREVARLRDELSGRTQELEAALAKVRDLAMRDDLTGLFNRRQLLEYLQRQKALADRDTLHFAICYVDLDHFKRVNDRFGHKQGDDVLRAFADVARRVVREEDFVARMGGEEFVLVLTNASVADAVRVADRLRRQTQLMMIHPDAPDFAVTASVGIAAYRKREPIEQLLNRADVAMYAAKSQGRNRVVVAPGIETNAMPGSAAR